MNQPHIIVGVPTYNRSHLIDRVLESVEGQGYEHWTLLFVDDASQDDTPLKIEEIQEHQPKVEYYRMPQNSGVNAVRNELIVQANKIDPDAYILFIDDDDYLAKDCLKYAADAIVAHPTYHWITLDCIFENGEKISRIKKYGELSYLDDYMFGRRLKGDLTHVVKLSEIGDVRFTDQFKNAEVWYFWSNLAAKMPLFAINKVGSIKEYLPEGITQNGFNRDRAIDVLKFKIDKLSPFVPEKMLIHQYVTLVKHLIAKKQHAEARQWLSKAFRLNPFYLRQYRYWLYLLF